VHATAIAQSIMAALREASMTKAGLPMIDEEGHPRAVEFNVDAAIVVEGEKNVVGEEAVAMLLRQRRHVIESFCSDTEMQGGDGVLPTGGSRTSHRRALSEPIQFRAKRARASE